MITSRKLLERLVAFDTTSRESNLALIDFVWRYLTDLGVHCELIHNAERSKAILERIPAGRGGEASDLGGAAVFLASRASDYVNGAIIPVDGGGLAR